MIVAISVLRERPALIVGGGEETHMMNIEPVGEAAANTQ